MNFTRPRFRLPQLAWLSLLLAVPAVPATAAAPASRPNVLWLTSEDRGIRRCARRIWTASPPKA